jgi:type IV pilus assembly protein PilV
MNDLASHRMRGFTLLEVLVALVILSIGLLGLAAMQASALSSTHGSQLESMVAIQARSLADAMSANPDYWSANSPTFAITPSPTSPTTPVISSTAPSAPTTACLNTACGSAADMAGYDVQLWAAELLKLVPGASATIACTASAPVGCSITIQWTEKAAASLNQGTKNNANSTSLTNMTYTLLNQI